MSDKVTIEHLKELQSAIKEQFIGLYKDNNEALRKIKSTTKIQGSSPCEELVKLSQLIKAHTTKLGIILKPDTFTETNYMATYKELKSFIDYVFFFFSLLPLFYGDKEYPEYMLKKLDQGAQELLSGMNVLSDELTRKFEERESDEDRLLCVGMIWSSCDALESIGQKGKYGLLADSIRESNGLIDDVLGEVAEFLEEPCFNNGDMMDDGFSSDEEEDDAAPSNLDDDPETLEKLTKFVGQWQTKLKMIKLLLSSFVSTISAKDYKSVNKKGSVLDDLHVEHSRITKDVDELFGDIFMADSTFDAKDFQEPIDTLNSSMRSMIVVMKRLNDDEAKKSKWLNVWEAKYFEN